MRRSLNRLVHFLRVVDYKFVILILVFDSTHSIAKPRGFVLAETSVSAMHIRAILPMLKRAVWPLPGEWHESWHSRAEVQVELFSRVRK